MPNENLPLAHENFAQHFTAGFYEDTGNELAPFGSDEGFDIITLAQEHSDSLTDKTTVEELLDIVEAPLERDWDEEPEDEDAVLIASAAFALLRITGRIDKAGRKKALKALEVLLDAQGDEPELLQQKADLKRWKA